MDLSIITPVYQAESCLFALYERLKITLESLAINFEIIMVEDHSYDNSWQIIKQLSAQDSRVKGIHFSRNFGQHYAIAAGLDYCSGEWVIVMDCDLQDRPEEIPKLYKKALEGYDIVLARRIDRQDVFFKKFTSFIFYKIFNFLTEGKRDHAIANFGIYSAQVISQLRQFKERIYSFPLTISLLGFSVATIDVTHSKRFAGKTSYNLYKQLKLAIDGILSQSNKILTYSINVGLFLSISAFIYSIYLTLKYIVAGTPVEGWTSIMVSIYFLSGLLFMNLGVIGLYLGKMFDELKSRPLYIIKETIGILK